MGGLLSSFLWYLAEVEGIISDYGTSARDRAATEGVVHGYVSFRVRQSLHVSNSRRFRLDAPKEAGAKRSPSLVCGGPATRWLAANNSRVARSVVLLFSF